MGEDLPIDLYGALKDFLGMYRYQDEVVLVLEAVANALDARAKKLNVTFEEGKYIIFANDAPGMTETQFQKYHTVSFSTKVKGKGIGFAGVGAKIFLASDKGSEIVTTTGTKGKVLASRMYRKEKKIQYETSMKYGLERIVGKSKIKPFEGTIYKVKLTSQSYKFLQNDMNKILQYWFSYAMISHAMRMFVDGREVKPWQPKGKRVRKIISVKGQKIECYFTIADDEIPEDWRHIVYFVYGKRIRHELFESAYQIGEKSSKVLALADVSILAKYLIANKEDFAANWQTNAALAAVRKEFYEFLKAEGLIKGINPNLGANVVTNELTKRLDKLLQQEELKFLNPWSNPRVRSVVVPDEGGDITIQEVPGQQIIHGEGQGGKGPGIDIVGGEEGPGYVAKEDGGEKGVIKERRAKGIAIIVEEFPEDPREGWVDLENRGVVYNLAHPFAKSISTSILFNYNLARVVISALIKSANDKIEMDAKTALELQEKLLHNSW